MSFGFGYRNYYQSLECAVNSLINNEITDKAIPAY